VKDVPDPGDVEYVRVGTEDGDDVQYE